MRIWVTRTQPGADRTAEKLKALGHQPVVQPVLVYVPILGAAVDLSGAAALAFTSAHGVAAYGALSPRRDLPAYVTGRATAASARSAGFTRVFAADGDVERLVALLIAERATIGGAVVWPCALEPAGDLAGGLAAAGMVCLPQPVYHTAEAEIAAPPGLQAVMVHSPRGARATGRLLTPAVAADLDLYAISDKAAEPLSALPFARVAIATQPNETALLDLIAG